MRTEVEGDSMQHKVVPRVLTGVHRCGTRGRDGKEGPWGIQVGTQDTRVHATVFCGCEVIEDGEKDTEEKDSCGQRFKLLIARWEGLMTPNRATGRECDPLTLMIDSWNDCEEAEVDIT